MKQLEHEQKIEMEKAEHQLRMEILSCHVAAYRGSPVQSSPV